MLDKSAIGQALRDIGMLMQVKGENPFKVRAYDNAAQTVEDLTADLGELVDEGRLTEVPGIGKGLAQTIAELYLTGRSPLLDDLRRELPVGVLDLLKVPDLGPKKIAALHKALGIGTVTALKAACEAGQVQTVKGFGQKTEHKILEGIKRYEQADQRTLLGDVEEIADRLLQHVRACPETGQADLAGSYRRGKETVADLDLVVGSADPRAVMDRFVAFPLCAEVMARGDTKCTIRLASGLQVDLRVVPEEDYATALHHFTGSKAHHIKLRGMARDRGLTISEWGVFHINKNKDGQPGAKLKIDSEEALYRKLGLPFIPPELREDEGEIEAGLAGALPDDLIDLQDLQGMVHCHTTYSDGHNSIEEMARAAEAMGLSYLTITDHSPAAAYAGGVTLDRLKRQWDEIDEVQERVRIRLLRGTESDILADGALDYPDPILERMEVVIASIHSRMKMDEDQMTARLIRTMRLPLFKIWGHGLGRLVGKRPSIQCRVDEVLDALASSPGRGAIEINGDPHRLDLEPRWQRAARQRGIPFVISSDAHSLAGLNNLRSGVRCARRGWVRKGEVLNALPADAFARAVRPVHSH